MSVEIGTAADHQDLFDKLRTFLKTGLGGSNWTELDYNATNRTMILEAPGLGGSESLYFGFGIAEDVGMDAFALRGWMFRAYNSGLGHEIQPGHSGSFFHPTWNTTIPYWFMANGQRVIIVTKISTVYTASYLGKFLPYGVPSEWPGALYIGMPRPSNIRWSSTLESYRNFFDPNGGSARLLLPDVSWVNVSNFTGDATEGDVTTGTFIWPYVAPIDGMGTHVKNRYRELRENLDGSYQLDPLVLCGQTPTPNMYGELDGAYSVTGFNTASEDIVVIDAEDYLVVQNVFRTTRYYYAAIKLA